MGLIARLFERFQTDDDRRAVARDLYMRCVAQARWPGFYCQGGVPDTKEGRFAWLSAHVALMLRRLKALDEDERSLAQDLVDQMMTDMDRSLREMGVGDLSVGKHVRKLAEAFYAQAQRLDANLTTDDRPATARLIAENVLEIPSAAVTPTVERLGIYLHVQAEILRSQRQAAALAFTHEGWPARPRHPKSV
ncbi:MAG: ubiquinol-cytochrome C chaperone family protein [Geminicoccaceae bacterium]